MKIKKYLLKFRLTILFFSAIIILTSISIISTCNVSYENVQDMLRTGLHSTKPPFSNIFHGSNYRFPQGSCNESQCHYSDLTGGNSGAPSCYRCHDDQWSVFSESHTLKVSGRYHHYAVDTSLSYIDRVANCGSAACHGDGTDLYTENHTGYNYRYACYECHDPIPPPGHRINKEGHKHHFNIGRDPQTYCYNMPGCHGAAEPGPVCNSPGCHSIPNPIED